MWSSNPVHENAYNCTTTRRTARFLAPAGNHQLDYSRSNHVGLFWDLYQQSQISQHAERAATLEDRTARLEQEVDRLSSLLREVIGRLEKHVGADLDGDGRVG